MTRSGAAGPVRRGHCAPLGGPGGQAAWDQRPKAYETNGCDQDSVNFLRRDQWHGSPGRAARGRATSHPRYPIRPAPSHGDPGRTMRLRLSARGSTSAPHHLQPPVERRAGGSCSGPGPFPAPGGPAMSIAVGESRFLARGELDRLISLLAVRGPDGHRPDRRGRRHRLRRGHLVGGAADGHRRGGRSRDLPPDRPRRRPAVRPQRRARPAPSGSSSRRARRSSARSAARTASPSRPWSPSRPGSPSSASGPASSPPWASSDRVFLRRPLRRRRLPVRRARTCSGRGRVRRPPPPPASAPRWAPVPRRARASTSR